MGGGEINQRTSRKSGFVGYNPLEKNAATKMQTAPECTLRQGINEKRRRLIGRV